MAYRVELTGPARRDADAAFEYIQNLSQAGAERWLRQLVEAIFSLSEMPAHCPIAPEAQDVGHPIRHLLFGKRTGTYRIIFVIREEAEGGAAVTVLRIWHGARDAMHVGCQ